MPAAASPARNGRPRTGRGRARVARRRAVGVRGNGRGVACSQRAPQGGEQWCCCTATRRQGSATLTARPGGCRRPCAWRGWPACLKVVADTGQAAGGSRPAVGRRACLRGEFGPGYSSRAAGSWWRGSYARVDQAATLNGALLLSHDGAARCSRCLSFSRGAHQQSGSAGKAFWLILRTQNWSAETTQKRKGARAKEGAAARACCGPGLKKLQHPWAVIHSPTRPIQLLAFTSP